MPLIWPFSRATPIDPASLTFTAERFEDAGEKDADGFYDYYYAGIYYTLTWQNLVCHATQYDHEAQIYIACAGKLGARPLRRPPDRDRFFTACVQRLLSETACGQYLLLCRSGYTPVDLTEL